MAFAAVAVAAVSFAYALRGRPKQALPANAPALDAAPAARAIVVTDLPIPPHTIPRPHPPTGERSRRIEMAPSGKQSMQWSA